MLYIHTHTHTHTHTYIYIYIYTYLYIYLHTRIHTVVESGNVYVIKSIHAPANFMTVATIIPPAAFVRMEAQTV